MTNNRIHLKKTAKFFLIFTLMTSTAFAGQYGFVDELSENDKISIKSVASKVNTFDAISDKSIDKLASLFNHANDETQANTFKFTFEELLNPAYFSKTTPSFVTNGSEDDAKKSFLNILGFGGKHFQDDVNNVTALKQYMPIAHIRKINGVTNVFFENPAFVDKNLGENIEYYNSNIGLERLVPTQGLSDQKQHDKFLRFAFSNQGDAEDLGVQEFSSRGSTMNNLGRLDRIAGAIAGKKYSSTRLPIVELVGKFYADKLRSELGEDQKITFSGSGFAGAVAQEVAYHAVKSGALKKDNTQIFTSQAMRYLSGQFASEFNETVGKDNVFSFNTARQRKMETAGLTHKHVYFEALGNQVRLETAAPTNGLLDDAAWNLGVTSQRYKSKLAKEGRLFKKSTNATQEIEKILEGQDLSQSINLESYARLAPIMASEQEKQTQASSNALATAMSGSTFVKTSQGDTEHENLVKIRQMFGLNNAPQLLDLSEDAKLVVPSSIYDGAQNVTTTIAPLAGNSSAYDSLKTILARPDFTDAGQQKGAQLGGILAVLHKKTGSVSHGDFHLNNIRFDKKGTAYVIDIESLGNNFIDGHKRDSNGFKDLVDLIAKTTSHMYKSGTYGANKGWFGNYFGNSPSKTEQAFAKGVFEGYIETASKEQLLSIKSQYEAFKKDYGSNVNRFLNGGWFSTYNNSVFQKVFQGNEFENLINAKLI